MPPAGKACGMFLDGRSAHHWRTVSPKVEPFASEARNLSRSSRRTDTSTGTISPLACSGCGEIVPGTRGAFGSAGALTAFCFGAGEVFAAALPLVFFAFLFGTLAMDTPRIGFECGVTAFLIARCVA